MSIIYFAPLIVILLISSCKKQIRNKSSLKNSTGEKKDIFSPVSELEAKKFAGSQQACTKTKTNKINKTNNQNKSNLNTQDFAELVRQNEAKLSDIPIPFNSEPIKDYFGFFAEEKKIIMGYKNYTKDLDIVTFYNQEMERLGWKNIAFFNGPETLMIFEKPSRLCSILLGESSRTRKAREHIKIIIFTQI